MAVDWLIAFLIISAISAFAVIEVLVAYQKYLMKKQFLSEMDSHTTEERNKQGS